MEFSLKAASVVMSKHFVVPSLGNAVSGGLLAGSIMFLLGAAAGVAKSFIPSKSEHLERFNFKPPLEMVQTNETAIEWVIDAKLAAFKETTSIIDKMCRVLDAILYLENVAMTSKETSSERELAAVFYKSQRLAVRMERLWNEWTIRDSDGEIEKIVERGRTIVEDAVKNIYFAKMEREYEKPKNRKPEKIAPSPSSASSSSSSRATQ